MEKLRHKAEKDTLTGVYNRETMKQQLQSSPFFTEKKIKISEKTISDKSTINFRYLYRILQFSGIK